jgi:hypothetical protein
LAVIWGYQLLIPETFDDHSLIMMHPKGNFDGFSGPDREDYFFKSYTVESDLIYLISRRIQTVEICQLERQTPQPSGGGWRMSFPMRR